LIPSALITPTNVDRRSFAERESASFGTKNRSLFSDLCSLLSVLCFLLYRNAVQNAGKDPKTRLNLFVLNTLRNKFLVINGPEKMIELYLAQNKALKPKNPVRGEGSTPRRGGGIDRGHT